jgi:CheY-like chemotaxis protein
VIDDDVNMRDLVRLALAPGVDVIDAANCEDAIAALRVHRDRVCLILLDYFMPGMDPVSCAREIIHLAGPVMVVLCTAAADPAAHAAEVGLTRWLAKPFALDTLQGLVHEAAARRRSGFPIPDRT